MDKPLIDSIQDLLTRVNSLEQKSVSLKVELSVKEREQQKLEEECEALGISTENLDEQITKLQKLLAELSTQLEEKVAKAEELIVNYESGQD